MNVIQETCVLCNEDIVADNKDSFVITKKGADSINKAGVERGDIIAVSAGTKVHKSCRLNYVNKKVIERHTRAEFDATPIAPKRSARVSTCPFDSKTDCLFCGSKVVTSKTSGDYDDYSFVRTNTFVEKLLLNCKSRNDDWAFTVWGRVE